MDRVASAVGAKEANVFQGDAKHNELESMWLSEGLNGIFETPSYIPALEEEGKIYSAIQEIVTESKLVASRDIQAEYRMRGYPPVDMSLIESILERDYGIKSRYTAPLNIQRHHYEFLTLHYPHDYDDAKFPHDRVQLGDFLIPHMMKAMSINRPFVLLQRRFNAVLEVLDRFQLGVMILGEDLSIWLRNESARRIITDGDAILARANGRLFGVNAELEATLKQAVTTLLADTDGSAPKATRFRMGNPSKREPYVVDMSVLNSEDLGTLQSKRGILMVVVDPLRTNIINSDSVAELFEFTQAEAEVFSLVIQGHTNRQVADIRNVGSETIATQLKSVFQKTGCKRRGDLVHLAHSVNIPVENADLSGPT